MFKFVADQLKETLPKEGRRKSWSLTNPFAFIRLFTSGAQVSFQWKNPDFLLKNPDFLLRNPDFLLKNVDFIILQLRKLSTVTLLHNMVDIKVTAGASRNDLSQRDPQVCF